MSTSVLSGQPQLLTIPQDIITYRVTKQDTLSVSESVKGDGKSFNKGP